MSPQAGWRHDNLVGAPGTGFTRCPNCYKRVALDGEGPEAALFTHDLSGGCCAHDAPKVRSARKTKKEQATEPTNSPTRLNDWAVMFDG